MYIPLGFRNIYKLSAHHPISAAIYTHNSASCSSVFQSYIGNLRFNASSTPKRSITALSESQVQQAIVCAHEHNLQMKIRNGGHFCVSESEYMIPFASMNPREAAFIYKDLDLGINHNGKASYSEGRVYGTRYFKDNFDRLVRIKTNIDPGNTFRNEQSIPTLPF